MNVVLETTKPASVVFDFATCEALFPPLLPPRESHSKRHISTFIISLRGSYSPTSVSSTRCQLDVDP